jgi:hypothetical protein
MPRANSLECSARRAKGAPARTEWGAWGPASERVGGSAGAKPPGPIDEEILDAAREFFGM